jgi:hypothetical protein
MSWGNTVLLEAHERIVNSWPGIWITIEKNLPQRSAKPKRKKEKAKERKKGYLVLTNHRILFLDEEQTMLKIPLTKFCETWMDKTPIEVVPPVGMENYVFRLNDVHKKEFKEFRELLIYYSQRGEHEPDTKNVSMKVG